MNLVIRRLTAGRIDRIPGLSIFLILQLLDVVTTLIGLEAGLSEANAFVRFMMQFGTVTGLLASKVVALLLAALCVLTGRLRVIRYICYWYAALVLWNIALICSV